MKCKLSEKCEFGNLCKDATRHDSLTVLGCSSFKTKEPMTNEEYLRSLNTEQLAETLKEMTDKCATCDTNQYDQRGECPFEICRIGLNEFVEWLKQPHTKE